MQSATREAALLFEAAVMPHRSLTRRGMLTLVGALCGLSAVVSTVCWWRGAWPVAGFSGAEILLAVALLRLNARQRRELELIMLYEDTLRVVRTDVRGRREERRLEPFWLNVVLEDRAGRVPRLLLAARGMREEIAARLGEAEKRDLAAALAAALHRMRNPRFDNSQLGG